MKYGWCEYGEERAHFYQYNFDAMLVLGKISKYNEMLKAQMNEKEYALRTHTIH